MPPKPCLTCGVLTKGSRCPTCEANVQRARNKARAHLYGGSWPRVSKAARAREPWCHCTRTGCHGNLFPCASGGDLTLDHETGQVECRSCNSRHRHEVGDAVNG